MPEEHAMLSASGSAKWLSCPAALALEALINEPDTGSAYAREGTAAHEVLEKALSGGMEPSSFLGSIIIVDGHNIEVTQPTIDAVEIATEYIRRLSAKNSFYEERVDYSHLAPGGFGTADVVLEVYEKVAPNERVNTLYIADFKYGAGIKVDAFENSQGMLYALGALNSLEFLFERPIEKVIIVIIQPRMDNISEYPILVDDLIAWGETVKPKAKHAYALYEEAKAAGEVCDYKAFKPTKDGCKWCQGRRLKKCKAHAQTGYSAAVEGFDDLTAEKKNDIPAIEVTAETIKDPAFLDNADLAAIYLKISMFMTFANELGDEIIRRIDGGQAIPGLKLISTECPRSWKDDDEASIKAMRTAGLQKPDYLKQSIISPTEAEKALKVAKPKDHTRRYKKLAATSIRRLPGKGKLIEDKTKQAEEDDLLG